MVKVEDLLKINLKLNLILEKYKDYTLEEMLDDINKKTSPTTPATKAALSTPDIIIQLQDMAYEERVNYITSLKYTNKELRNIIRNLGIKGKSNAKKADLIKAIAGHQLVDNLPDDNSQSARLEIGGGEENKEADAHMAEAVMRLPEMNQDAIIEYLEPFRKYEILEIARRLNVKIAKSNTRDNIILLIAKHFGYKDINRRILERPKRER